jgi:hypothetical protein
MLAGVNHCRFKFVRAPPQLLNDKGKLDGLRPRSQYRNHSTLHPKDLSAAKLSLVQLFGAKGEYTSPCLRTRVTWISYFWSAILIGIVVTSGFG